MLALLSSCNNSPAQTHFMLCAHTAVLINACKPAVRVPLCHCGLTDDSRTSLQQSFTSDVLVSIAAYASGPVALALHVCQCILYSNPSLLAD